MAYAALERMDFEPTPEQHRLVELATSFAGEAAAALPRDPTGFAAKACGALGGRGLFATRATLDAALIVIALSRVSAALGATFAAGFSFLDALRRGDSSDALGVIATAVEAGTATGAVAWPSTRKGDETLLVAAGADGVSILSGVTGSAPLVPVAGHAVIAVESGANSVVACVDLTTKGVTRTPAVPSLGLDEMPRGALELHRVAVAKEHVLFTGALALEAARRLAQTRNVLSAAAATGVAGRALDRALAHVRGNGKLSQSTEFTVSDLATGYEAALLATARAAWLRDRGESAAAECAGAKLLAARTATELCHGALKICGEGGYDDELRRAYLDARHLELYDGAEAAQIDVIAKEMLGES
jgi:alkylation response protein AidB-like acyl-CoA dehydrogenase